MSLLSPEKSWNSVTEINAPSDAVWEAILSQFSLSPSSISVTTDSCSSLEVNFSGESLYLDVLLSDEPRLLSLRATFGDNSAEMRYLLTEVNGRTQIDELVRLTLRCPNKACAVIANRMRDVVNITSQQRLKRATASVAFQGRPIGMNAFAVKRLSQIGVLEGERFELWQQHWRRNPGKGFWSTLREAERMSELWNQWIPEFQEFAREIRERRRLFAPSSTTREQEARAEFLQNRMQEHAELNSKSDEWDVLVGRINLVQIANEYFGAALQVFGGKLNSIVLTTSEYLEWEKRFRYIPSWSNSCCKICHWDLSDSFSLEYPRQLFELMELHPLSQGQIYWFYTFNEWSGVDAASGNSELWLWDGDHPKLLGCWDSWMT